MAIARALALQPTFLIVDEPTGQLDSHTLHEILDLFRQLNRQGLTSILATHDPLIGSQNKRTIQQLDGKVVNDVRSS